MPANSSHPEETADAFTRVETSGGSPLMSRNESALRISDTRWVYMTQRAREELGDPERVEIFTRTSDMGQVDLELVGCGNDFEGGSFKLGKVGSQNGGRVISGVRICKALGLVEEDLPLYIFLSPVKFSDGRKALRGTLAKAR
jgi:hypothetical protein